MPVYDYECPDCGPFSALRSMADYQAAADCPSCASAAPRILLSAPALAQMEAGRRSAFTTNERSRNEPRRSGAHAPGCGCCSGRPLSRTRQSATGAKSFPSARPWMISH
ncbi:FmdB family zinc ribbon protein [Chelatococcus reniformis]|uniref:Putative regulatory protein FmdB zinc ribbon domain-containing protein n=1 Tax=Chelatococcus reniformis TaxID=1494448 RepID=A0A916X6S7_9HYPH|nr:zinc ribbon domain-containing protein [Chelatococcus reniformis]GGC47598.1 hypothetical protein GCM10010994_03460 [Chelatococcus reniformis]